MKIYVLVCTSEVQLSQCCARAAAWSPQGASLIKKTQKIWKLSQLRWLLLGSVTETLGRGAGAIMVLPQRGQFGTSQGCSAMVHGGSLHGGESLFSPRPEQDPCAQSKAWGSVFRAGTGFPGFTKELSIWEQALHVPFLSQLGGNPVGLWWKIHPRHLEMWRICTARLGEVPAGRSSHAVQLQRHKM